MTTSASGSGPLGTDELQGVIRRVEPAALLVPARILRRVIKKHKGLGGLGLGVPHHKSYIIDRDTLLKIATPSELHLADGESLPERVLLMPRPEQALPAPVLLLRYWRQLFHEEVHRAFGQLGLDGNAIQSRLHRIGAVPFEEIRDVLRQENLLFAPDDPAAVYEEFAAVFLELRQFEPRRVDDYFPALVDADDVAKLLSEDVDSEAIFRRTRLDGAPDPAEEAPTDVTPPGEMPAIEKTTTAPDVIRVRAEQVARAGNQVRAALLLARAIAVSPETDAAGLHAAAGAEMESLTGRLQRALGFPVEERDEWTKCLRALLPAASAASFWNAEVRLLYDLQKACIDMERPLFAADFVEWFVSWFQRPIKRPLPDQPFVLIVKHLRSALGRLPAARMPAEARERLGELLRGGLHEAERRMRLTFQPQIVESLDKVGLAPRSEAERLSRDQAVEELLDTIGRRGTISIGDLRDAVARSRLKLPDLTGPGQFFMGDALIRANRELAGQLDGVYRRGEIYLRWLQRLGSIFFGTQIGRLATLYVILPLLGSLMILKFGEELTHYGGAAARRISKALAPARAEGYYTITPDEEDGGDEWNEWDFLDEPPAKPAIKAQPSHGVELFNAYSFFGLAAFLVPVVNVPPFRRVVFRGLWYLWVGVRWIFYDAPVGFFRLPMVRAIFQSPAYLLFWQFVGKPLLWVIPAFLLMLLYRVPLVWALGVAASLFALLSVVGNMRLGLVVEEVTADRAVRAWQLVRDDLLPGLFGYFVWLSRFVFDRTERVMYAVDEQLRFRQGQSQFAFVVKLVLGLVWFLFTYLFRLVYNVFFEPQVNPIKHFPVVTVAHKLTFPLIIPAAEAMKAQLGWTTERAGAVAAGLQFTTPGMWGFLAWELKEDWRIYRANQAENLEPAIVGGHGEHVINYIRRGFHSGTLPKLFAKLRNATGKKRRQAEDGLHHVGEELGHFLQRELFATLAVSKRWPKDAALSVGVMDLATNRIRIELCCPKLAAENCWLDFTNRGGLLVAGLLGDGWLATLPGPARDALAAALAGFYKRAGVDLVAEQMRAVLLAGARYEVQEGKLLISAPGLDGVTAYDLEKPDGPPQPARESLPKSATAFLFRARPVRWSDWEEHWRRDAAGEVSLPPLAGGMEMLPEVKG